MHSSGGTVALAVVLRTAPGAPFEHLARDGRRISGIDAPRPRAASMGLGTPTTGTDGLVVGGIPIGCPLPDVADHVQQAVVIGGKAAHGCGALKAIEDQVLPGEL